MADTKRVLSALLTLFADNTTEEITEQDFRDLVVSVVGSRGISAAAVTTSDTLDTDDDVVIADASGGAVTLTLPARASSVGKIYTVKRISASNNVVVQRAGSDTIDGATSKTLGSQYAAITLIAGPSEWNILNSMGTIT